MPRGQVSNAKRWYWHLHARLWSRQPLRAWLHYICACLVAEVSGLIGRHGRASRRIALMVWGFPPAVWGGVYRPAALCRHIPQDDFQIQAITGPAPENPSAAGTYLLAQINPRVSLHRVDARMAAGFKASADRMPSLDGGLGRMLAHHATALQALSGPPALVFASGPHFASFVAAYLIARRFRARLVLEYRDEWTQCPFPFVHAGELDRRWERRCLRAADRVIFTTESQRLHQLACFPELTPDRCCVIPNGWEPDDMPTPAALASSGHPQTRRKTIAFAGFLGDHTLPKAFLAEIGALLQRRPDLQRGITFRFIGTRSPRAQVMLQSFPFPEAIETVDQLAKPQALAAMQHADVLFLLNPPEFARYIPGKLYDYLAMRKPILVFGAGGEIERLVAAQGSGWIVPMDDAAALERTLTVISRGEMVTPATDDSWLAEHSRAALARQTWDLVAKVLDADPLSRRRT